MRVTLYSNLHIDDCLTRLASSGWAGRDEPGEWRPTATDRDLFRKVEGRTFQLLPRKGEYFGQRWYARPFAPRFVGTLAPEGRGTRITGEYRTQLARPLATIGAIFAVALLLGLVNPLLTQGWQGISASGLPRSGLTALALYAGIVGVLVIAERKLSGDPAQAMARCTRYLEGVLDARWDENR